MKPSPRDRVEPILEDDETTENGIIQRRVPIAFLQVYPLALKSHRSYKYPPLSAPLVKMYLNRMQHPCTVPSLYRGNELIDAVWDEETFSRIEQYHETGSRDAYAYSPVFIFHGSLYLRHSFIPSKSVETSMKQLVKKYEEQYIHESMDKGRILCPVSTPFIYLPSDDPTDTAGIPCLVRVHTTGLFIPKEWHQTSLNSPNKVGYTDRYNNVSNRRNRRIHLAVELSESTMVQICPPIETHAIIPNQPIAIVHRVSGFSPTKYIFSNSLHQHIMGEIDVASRKLLDNADVDGDDENAVFSCYDSELIHSLTLRMHMLLSRAVHVGTTLDAFDTFNVQVQQRSQRQKSLRKFWGKCNLSNEECSKTPTPMKYPSESDTTNVHSAINYGALTVHDSCTGSGKTTLVSLIARKILKCKRVHIINVGAIFAKYGASSADSALETLLHSLILSSAVETHGYSLVQSNCSSTFSPLESEIGNMSICIILDHLDSFASPRILGEEIRGSSDPFNPALIAICKS